MLSTASSLAISVQRVVPECLTLQLVKTSTVAGPISESRMGLTPTRFLIAYDDEVYRHASCRTPRQIGTLEDSDVLERVVLE